MLSAITKGGGITNTFSEFGRKSHVILCNQKTHQVSVIYFKKMGKFYFCLRVLFFFLTATSPAASPCLNPRLAFSTSCTHSLGYVISISHLCLKPNAWFLPSICSFPKVFPILVSTNFIDCWGPNPGSPTQTVSSHPTPHLLPSPLGLAFKMHLKSIISYFLKCDHQVSSGLSLAQLRKGTFQRWVRSLHSCSKYFNGFPSYPGKQGKQSFCVGQESPQLSHLLTLSSSLPLPSWLPYGEEKKNLKHLIKFVYFKK